MSTGERVRKLRKAMRLKQGELAEMIGNDGNTISRWEHGKIGIGSAYIMKLAQALNTTTDYLLCKTDSSDPPSGVLPTSSTSDDVVREEKIDKKKEAVPYTQEQVNTNKGMLVYVLSNGERIELPPIKDSYDFLRDITARSTVTFQERA